MQITSAEAIDLRARGLLGFLFDGDTAAAMAALGTDGSTFVIETPDGNLVCAIAELHPLTDHATHSEHAHFVRSQYLDRTSGTAARMTAVEVAVCSPGAFADPADGDSRRILATSAVRVR